MDIASLARPALDACKKSLDPRSVTVNRVTGRSEFIGKAERVKEIFLATATDLRRDRYFQGAGLVDLMRAIQSV